MNRRIKTTGVQTLKNRQPQRVSAAAVCYDLLSRSNRRRSGKLRAGNRGIPFRKLGEIQGMGRLIGGVECDVAAVVQALKIEVLMVRQFRMDTHDRRHADIRADSGDPAEVHPQIRKGDVRKHAARSLAQTMQMVPPQDSIELVDDLHKRLDLAGRLLIGPVFVCKKSISGKAGSRTTASTPVTTP